MASRFTIPIILMFFFNKMGSIKCVLLDNKITYKYYTHVANICNTTAKF